MVGDREITWYKYVDDIFAIIPLNLNVEEFRSSLNGMSTSIQFTSKYEVNDALSFLDVTLNLENVL